jgi:hypothetical protein
MALRSGIHPTRIANRLVVIVLGIELLLATCSCLLSLSLQMHPVLYSTWEYIDGHNAQLFNVSMFAMCAFPNAAQANSWSEE